MFCGGGFVGVCRVGCGCGGLLGVFLFVYDFCVVFYKIGGVVLCFFWCFEFVVLCCCYVIVVNGVDLVCFEFVVNMIFWVMFWYWWGWLE